MKRKPLSVVFISRESRRVLGMIQKAESKRIGYRVTLKAVIEKLISNGGRK